MIFIFKASFLDFFYIFDFPYETMLKNLLILFYNKNYITKY